MVDQPPQEELAQLLHELKQALRVASFSEIVKISEKFERVYKSLVPQIRSADDHDSIKSDIDKVLNMLAASIKGIQSAQKKVSQYGQPKAAFVTYSSKTTSLKS